MDGPIYTIDTPSVLGVISYNAERFRITPKPVSKIVFACKDGKTAILDLSTDVVTFGGECAVDESARVFGEALGILKQREEGK